MTSTKFFDCLHVIVTFHTGLVINGFNTSDQFDFAIGEWTTMWKSEKLFLENIFHCIKECHDVSKFPVMKISCCWYCDEHKPTPDWYNKANGKWDGEALLKILFPHLIPNQN